MIKLLMTAAVSMTLASAASAEPLWNAPSAEPLQTVKVFHGDLNLASTAGQEALAARIERAARSICGSEGVLDLDRQRLVRECRAAVHETAVPQVREAVIAAGGGASMRGIAAQTAIVGN